MIRCDVARCPNEASYEVRFLDKLAADHSPPRRYGYCTWHTFDRNGQPRWGQQAAAVSALHPEEPPF